MKPYRFCPYCRTSLKRREIDGIDRPACPECGWINYLNPVPAVACIVRERGKILLVKRGVEPQKGKWSLPAGFMELGETPRQAVLRELKEETSIEGEIKELIDVYAQPSENYFTVLTVGYRVVKTGGSPRAGDDVDDVQFKKINSPRDIPFVSHRQMLIDSDEFNEFI
ncbi:MAG: NUDIX domain-containing protein [Elusimicrobiota bacterium]|nr:NUDIX domain-containing protein [Elusimicrobiota bacterium]